MAAVGRAAPRRARDHAGPSAIAPYDVHVVALPGAEAEAATGAAEQLVGRGLDVLLDDRDQRAGEKFADADLIGLPDARHGRQEDASRTARSTCATARPAPTDAIRRRRDRERRPELWRRRRRFSSEDFGPTVERLMDETGVTYRGSPRSRGSPPAT